MSKCKRIMEGHVQITVLPQSMLEHWKMRVITVYDDEREEIITYVSTYDMQGQSNKGKLRPKKQSGRRDFILNT